jgi:uncharacterized protein (TIGR02246 family)
MSRRSVLTFVVAIVLTSAIAARSQSASSPSSGSKGAAPSAHSAKAATRSVAKNEAQIRDLYERWAKSFRAKDLPGIMAVYAPGDEVVAYDIVPPLQYKGKSAYEKDYSEFMAMYDGPIGFEFGELRVVAGDNVAFVHALERISGTMKNGQKSDIWLRATSGLRKINGKWLIVHDHISVPTNMETGKAALDLKP